MDFTLTENGSNSQPHSARSIDQTRLVVSRDQFKAVSVLAQNLKALMQSKAGPKSQLALAKKSGVGQATIGRILREETAASIDTVEEIAAAYGLQAWQLMVAGMDPTNPPVLVPISKAERALYDSLKAAMKEAAATKE